MAIAKLGAKSTPETRFIAFNPPLAMRLETDLPEWEDHAYQISI
jgi:hypothetical protein